MGIEIVHWLYNKIFLATFSPVHVWMGQQQLGTLQRILSSSNIPESSFEIME